MPGKTPPELLSELAKRAKEAEESAAAAMAKNRTALEARRDAIEASIDQSKTKLAGNAEEAKSKWGQMQSTLQKNFADKRAEIKADLDAQRASRDAKRAVRRADDAESEAVVAVGLALDAIENAEYEVIDAVLARAEAEELTPA
jgi:hypothetical protein